MNNLIIGGNAIKTNEAGLVSLTDIFAAAEREGYAVANINELNEYSTSAKQAYEHGLERDLVEQGVMK